VQSSRGWPSLGEALEASSKYAVRQLAATPRSQTCCCCCCCNGSYTAGSPCSGARPVCCAVQQRMALSRRGTGSQLQMICAPFTATPRSLTCCCCCHNNSYIAGSPCSGARPVCCAVKQRMAISRRGTGSQLCSCAPGGAGKQRHPRTADAAAGGLVQRVGLYVGLVVQARDGNHNTFVTLRDM
jgi:hypothetical protein